MNILLKAQLFHVATYLAERGYFKLNPSIVLCYIYTFIHSAKANVLYFINVQTGDGKQETN